MGVVTVLFVSCLRTRFAGSGHDVVQGECVCYVSGFLDFYFSFSRREVALGFLFMIRDNFEVGRVFG